MLHVCVLCTVVAINHAIKLSFGSPVADSATPLLYMPSVRLLCEVVFYRPRSGFRRGYAAVSHRYRSIGEVLLVHFRGGRFFRMLAMLRTFTHKGKQKNVFILLQKISLVEPSVSGIFSRIYLTTVWVFHRSVKDFEFWSLDLLSFTAHVRLVLSYLFYSCTSRSRILSRILRSILRLHNSACLLY